MIITVVGFCIVFVILTILICVIKLFGHVMAPKVRKVKKIPVQQSTNSVREEEDEVHIPAIHSAAIATALHLYTDDNHDKESYILRINKVARRYSPWNSKIYGLNQLK
ncbi:MAG: OadG family protein [bacterium]|nr:OadG family protein [Candidatus Minthenecus merdequi]